MICPYCKKSLCMPDVVYRNVETYGSKHINFRCLHCNKVVHSYVTRKVVFEKPVKTNDESDW